MAPPAPRLAKTAPAPAAVFLLPPMAWPAPNSQLLTVVVPPRKFARPAPPPTPTRPATLAVPGLLSPPVATLFVSVLLLPLVGLGPITTPPSPALSAPPTP